MTAFAQAPGEIFQVAFRITAGPTWQILKPRSFGPAPQELELAAPLGQTKESRVVLQRPDVLVGSSVAVPGACPGSVSTR